VAADDLGKEKMRSEKKGKREGRADSNCDQLAGDTREALVHEREAGSVEAHGPMSHPLPQRIDRATIYASESSLAYIYIYIYDKIIEISQSHVTNKRVT
jgi:hypothetical protein